jgi:RIO kinase 1
VACWGDRHHRALSARRTIIARKIDPHAHHESFEPPRKRRVRRPPKGRQNVTQLLDDEGLGARGSALRRLQERGFVHTIVGELKSGKEATVYLGDGPLGQVAVKIFRDLEVRSFKNDQRYTDGRWIGDARLAKAIRHRSGRGRRALKSLWAAHEYLMLWRLHRAGLAVPEPLVGPEMFDIVDAGEVVLMRFIGDPDAPAQRLSDAPLSEAEVASAAEQAVELLRSCWRAGVVHGDFSAYNLLWYRGQVTLIDFPQAMERSNAGAAALLEQDVASLTLSLRRLGVHLDAPALLASLLEGPASAD